YACQTAHALTCMRAHCARVDGDLVPRMYPALRDSSVQGLVALNVQGVRFPGTKCFHRPSGNNRQARMSLRHIRGTRVYWEGARVGCAREWLISEALLQGG
ncbi:MAG: hypothetical protein AB1664_15515, partial [Thermodesulfobacteriota bacterium]